MMIHARVRIASARLAVINKIGDVSLFGARKPIARQFQGLPNSEQIIVRLTHFTRGSWPVGCRQQPNSEGAMEDHAARRSIAPKCGLLWPR